MEAEDVHVVDGDRPRLKSTVHSAQGRSSKGRGINQANDRMTGDFDRMDDGGQPDESTAQKSVDGWVIFVTGLHEETATEDLAEACGEFGEVRNTWMNLDRQTGYVKGYALIEYKSRDEAEAALEGMDKSSFLDREIRATWAFVKPPRGGRGFGRRR
eukprot:jgi/Ulvmu1/10172/UM006_0127.1